LLAYVAKKYSRQPRWVHAFDSFEGMPAPTAADKHDGVAANATGWGTGTCAAPVASLAQVCAMLGVQDIVRPVKGYFEQTLPKMRDAVGVIALLHLDGDWYESTRTILENLYDRTSNDALLQVDDYGFWEGCRQAVHEFEQQRGLTFSLNTIDSTGVWFRKPNRFPVNTRIAADALAAFHEIDPVHRGVLSQMCINERFQLFDLIQRFIPRTSRPLRYIEVGSYAGGSLALIHGACKRSHDRVEGFAVEPGGQPQFFDVLKSLGNEVTHLRAFSHEAAPKLKTHFEHDGNPPRLILIDGDHSHEGVRRDILDYYPLLAPGGVIIFHDFLPPLDDSNRSAILFHHGGSEPGIRRACEELMEQTFHAIPLDLPLLHPTDPTQTQAHLPIIPGVFSTLRAYRKPD
jgi:predicted O-methyltransferase YrrM